MTHSKDHNYCGNYPGFNLTERAQLKSVYHEDRVVSLLPDCRPLQDGNKLCKPLGELEPVRPGVILPILEISGSPLLFGLGEASHGVSEFCRWKTELIQWLAEDESLSAIIFEMPFGSCRPIDEYITQGHGTAWQAVRANPYWLYHTREMVSLVETLRAINVRRQSLSPRKRLVRLIGYDTQFCVYGFRRLEEHLRAIGLEETLAEPLTTLRYVLEEALQPIPPLLTPIQLEQLLGDLAEIETRLGRKIREAVDGWPLRLHLTVFRAAMRRLCIHDGGDINTIERLHADIVLCILDCLPAHERAVLWGHDFHVGRWSHITLSPEQSHPYWSLGFHLWQNMGERYRNLGFETLAGHVGPQSPTRAPLPLMTPPSSLAELIAQRITATGASLGNALFNVAQFRKETWPESIPPLTKTLHAYGPPKPPYTAEGWAEAFDGILLCPRATPSIMF